MQLHLFISETNDKKQVRPNEPREKKNFYLQQPGFTGVRKTVCPATRIMGQ